MKRFDVLNMIDSLRPLWEDSCDGTRVLNQLAEHVYRFREDEPALMQKGKDGMIYPCPMPVQPEPSPLDVALRLMEMKIELSESEIIVRAFEIIEAVKAEGVRRMAG